ncbi:MAG: hypothetical protein KAR20_22660, partial [Candidatus Heimdallarchaeota archaeon]|nr:hypothetical protein [Candidatus Heimdallarchaeota archaeon]
GLATLKNLTKEFPGNPWAIQATNFLNIYNETGILPGTIIESEEAPILPGFEDEETTGETVEQLPPLDDSSPFMETDTTSSIRENETQTDSTITEEPPKSILEEIPENTKRETTNLDSLLEKLDQ